MEHELEAQSAGAAVFLTGYPVGGDEPCARLSPGMVAVLNRFEPLVDGIEVVHGYEDEPDGDAFVQRARVADLYDDEQALAWKAIDAGLVPAGSVGLGIGVERLCMAASGVKEITVFQQSAQFRPPPPRKGAAMSLSLHPLDDSGFGAVVDCNLATDAADLAPQLARALHRHRLLIVPGQHLNHADLRTAASCFGDVDTRTDRRYTVGGFPGLTPPYAYSHRWNQGDLVIRDNFATLHTSSSCYSSRHSRLAVSRCCPTARSLEWLHQMTRGENARIAPATSPSVPELAHAGFPD
ncbi:hypothetical protein ACFU8Q_25230 [Streptomyces sp. NPDC057543]|uniref:hypothetical protein n=1 Tax=Streptomyces sp. NPDC057543 TaxID=3346163 RepID=UPI0036ACE4E7